MRGALPPILIALLLVLPAVAAQTDDNGTRAQRHPCDFDADGFVSDAERGRCAAVRDRCDANGDGAVDEAERRRCDPARRDRCDADEDGAASEAEKARCAPPGDPCGFDGDGARAERERERCQEALDRCDADGNGRVDEAERARCAREGDGAGRAGPSAECREAVGAVQEDRERLRVAHDERRRAFVAEQEQRVQAYARENHTEEEWRAFREETKAAHDAFESGLREEVRAFETAARERLSVCGAPADGAAAAPACDASPEALDRFQRHVAEEERRFREQADLRLAKLQERLAAQRASFLEENRTQEEIAVFEERQAATLARFHADMEDQAVRHRAALERKWHELQESHGRACLGGDRDHGDIQSDVRGERVACGLEIQARLDAFFGTHGQDASAWSNQTRDAYGALKRAIRADMEACEKRLHEKWSEAARARFETGPREDRMGDFAFEPDGSSGGTVSGRFVSFAFETGSLTLRDYSVQGLLVFERFVAPHASLGRPSVEGSVLSGDGCATAEAPPDECPHRMRLKIHDNPTGAFHGACTGGDDEDAAGHPHACLLVFPAHAQVEPGEPEGETSSYRVVLGDQRALLHVRGSHAWTGNALEVLGGWRLLLPGRTHVLEVADKHRDEIRAAVEGGHVLAEVSVVAGEAGVRAQAIDYGSAEAPAEDAVDVRVSSSAGGVAIDLDAEASGGRTLVFNLDRALFGEGALAADDLTVTYFEVAADGARTEVAIARADGLADVLVPDEEVPEYWIVQDADGFQLLVSNPHFSAKRIEVQPARAGEAPAADGPTTGGSTQTPGAGPALLLAAAAVLARARRRRT